VDFTCNHEVDDTSSITQPHSDHAFVPLKGRTVIMADNEYNAEEAAGTIAPSR
jgi:hypothetical protein